MSPLKPEQQESDKLKIPNFMTDEHLDFGILIITI